MKLSKSYIAAFMALVFASLFYILDAKSYCDEKGGKIVRGLVFYECVVSDE